MGTKAEVGARCAVLVLIVSLALSVGAARAQEEPPVEPTPTVEVAAEPTSPAPPPDGVPVGQLVQRFQFEDADGWLRGEYDFIIAAQENGRYLLRSTDITGIVYSGALDLDDFYAQVELYPQSCPSDGGFGIAFRLNTDPVSDYYFFYVQCDRFFNAGSMAGGEANLLVQGALEQPVRIASAERHVMGVMARGSQIDLYWDGAHIGGFTDTLRTRGELGLSVAPSSQGEAVIAAFDNLSVWELRPVVEETTGQEAPIGEHAFAFPFTQAGSWFIGEDAFVRAALFEERYVVTPLSGTAALFSGVVDVDDFYAQVNIFPVECPPTAIIGLAFRQQQPGHYYVFGVRCDGAWLVQTLPPGESPFLTGQLDAPLRTDSAEPHVVAVLAQGQLMTIYWDGQALGTIEDAALSHGDVGFHLQAGVGDGELTVAFDDLEIWEVEQAPLPGGAAPRAGEEEQPGEGGAPAGAEGEPEVAGVAPPVAVGPIRYETDFDQARNWITGDHDFVSASVEDGRYVLSSTDIVGTIFSGILNLSDFYAQYQVMPIQCLSIAAFGLPFRIDRESVGDFYVAIMQCDGNWRLSRIATDEAGNTQGDVLINGSLGAPLTIEQPHTIGVSARGPEIIYFWDGAELGRVADDTHVAGDIGFQVRPVFPTYETLIISVDYYRIWYLP
jgi:hypothetical protein